MTVFLKVLTFLKNNLWIVIIALCVALYISIQKTRSEKANSDRISNNFEQIQKKGTQELTMKVNELKEAISDKTELGLKVDSLLKVVKAKPKQAKEIVIEKIVYRDTGRVVLVPGMAIPTESGYRVPVAFDSECWGIKADIITGDPKSTLSIIERKATNEVSLLVIEKRRWIFWKKRTFHALSKCGELNITKIDIIK